MFDVFFDVQQGHDLLLLLLTGMLVLSRHRNESIIIGDDIVITVVDFPGVQVRLAIVAPLEISVHRQEVYEAIQREVRQASSQEPPSRGQGRGRLVLSRYRDQSIVIGNDIVITVVDIRGDKARLGIDAPITISVHRQEVYEAIQRENQEAARLEPHNARQIDPQPVKRDPRRTQRSGGGDF